MRRIIFFLVLASLVVGLLLPALPVFAEKPPEEQTYTEFLSPGETRVNDHTVIKKIREVPGTKNIEYTAEISSLPETLSDLKTLIICEWRQGSDLDGSTYYENGNNLYSARVTGTRVSVEYDSKLAAWNPTLRLGSKELSLLSGPTLVKDPLNSNYGYNTVQWVYKIGNTKITRYLRQIEGSLQEYYFLDKDPGATLEISNGYEQEKGFEGEGGLYAFDSRGTQLLISGDSSIKLVTKDEFARKDIKYPVTIDPTNSYTVSSQDAGLYIYNSVYATARTSTSGTVGSGSWFADIGQIFFGPNYYISRYATYFDTSAVPLTCTITSGSVQLSGYGDASDTDFSIVVQSGMPSSPSSTPIATDYNQALYTGVGGSFNTGTFGWSVSGYNIIPLDATGLGWINKGGITKFMLRSDRDINNNTPYGQEMVGAFTYEFGSGYQPKLVLTYTLPASPPVISSLGSGAPTSTQALLLGQLVSDGGVPCSVRFDYGTTVAYGTPTAWQSGFVSGQTFAAYTDALAPGTLYHWTARASNSGGTSSANDATFLTLPEAPTVFTVTPDNLHNDLAYTKGTGSGNTYIYRRTDHAPTLRTEAGNVLVYSGAAAAYIDTPLTNGVTYYYSAWAEKTTSGLQQFSSTYMSGSGTPFTTGKATVTTKPATGYDTAPGTSATFHGVLVALNGHPAADCYFQYYWGAGAFTDHTTIASMDTLTAPGDFDVTLAVGSLPAATLIHMRAVADNGDVGGLGEGADISFTTGSASAPTVTGAATGWTKTTANVGGIVVSTGGESSITVWFKYGTTTAYGHQTTPITLSPCGNGQTFGDVLGLNPYPLLEVNTLYHFVAVAQNSIGISESPDGNFTTLTPAVPVVVTLSAINVGATEADLQGTLSQDGGVPCQVEFEYGPTAAYEFGETGWQGSYISGQSFSVHLTGIVVGNTTHFRAKAKNAGGTHNGSDSSFTTLFTAPTSFMAKALDSSTLSVTWKKVGDQTLVVIKKGSSPADRLDGDTYQGADEAYSFTGLEDGVTYFLKAWSWKSDGTYSTDYVEDACTTPGAGTAPEGAADSTLEAPEAPGWWFGVPSGARMANWPGYSAVESGASGWGIPSSTAWLIYWAILLTALVGAAGVMTSSGMVMLLVLVLGLFAMAAIIGALGWLIIVMGIIGVSVVLITSR